MSVKDEKKKVSQSVNSSHPMHIAKMKSRIRNMTEGKE